MPFSAQREGEFFVYSKTECKRLQEKTSMKSQRPRNRAILTADFPTDSLPKILRSKYKLRILWDLQHGSSRFGEIRKRLSLGGRNTKEVAPRVLSQDLKSLVTLRLIHRKAYNVVPPRVEYRLTTLGRSLLLVIAKIVEWGKRHPSHSHIVGKPPCFDQRRHPVGDRRQKNRFP